MESVSELFFTLQWSNIDTNFSRAHRLVSLNVKGGGGYTAFLLGLVQMKKV